MDSKNLELIIDDYKNKLYISNNQQEKNVYKFIINAINYEAKDRFDFEKLKNIFNINKDDDKTIKINEDISEETICIKNKQKKHNKNRNE